ncbi:MAG: dTDP-4-dehydrorhamnose reductase [Bacteroidaceae bacterium]|nr:dTDP-4-dehydrorhamnose reductase [Bacteroidaceae bacterium]
MAVLLITGANGQLGNEMRCIADRDNVNSYIFTDVEELDITNFSDICNFVEIHKPDFIINCAAYTAVDKAEDDSEICAKINTLAVENLANAAKIANAKVIHVSTDYVYGGDATMPYIESDTTNPKSVYGKTKLEGEIALANILPEQSITIRTSWLYSSFGRNFVKTMISLGKERESLNVVCDQRGTPTFARDLANAIMSIVNSNKFESGIYNYSNEGECSWHEFACEIFKIADIDCMVNAITTDQYPTKAQRPAYSVLDKSKIKKVYGLEIPEWRESLKDCIKLLNSNID